MKTKKEKKKKVFTGASMAEMLVALGLAGSVIFIMLVIAVRTGKVAAKNQQRYISSQAAGEAVELTVLAHKLDLIPEEVVEDVCNQEVEYIAIMSADPDQGEPVAIQQTGLITKQELQEFGLGDFLVLPMKQGDDGRWEECAGCQDSDISAYRGVKLSFVPANLVEEAYWNAHIVVFWEIFEETEVVEIDTRLRNICPAD